VRLLIGQLNERTLTMLRMTAMTQVWPALLNEWRLIGWPDECWLTFYRAGEPRLVERPPRIRKDIKREPRRRSGLLLYRDSCFHEGRPGPVQKSQHRHLDLPQCRRGYLA
jgi:hypothetical protein